MRAFVRPVCSLMTIVAAGSPDVSWDERGTLTTLMLVLETLWTGASAILEHGTDWKTADLRSGGHEKDIMVRRRHIQATWILYVSRVLRTFGFGGARRASIGFREGMEGATNAS